MEANKIFCATNSATILCSRSHFVALLYRHSISIGRHYTHLIIHCRMELVSCAVQRFVVAAGG
jgi:hypothetical protein